MRRVLPLVGAVLWLACPGTEERIAQAALAEGCVLNSECQEPLVCAFRRCHTQCESDSDCIISGKRLSCVPSDRPYKVCLLENESTCVYHTDCPPTLRCARDLHCRLECQSAADCVTGQVCTQGACASEEELVNGVLPVITDAGAPPGSATCAYTSDCDAPLVCLAGACRPECVTTRDCGSGLECVSGTCVDPGRPDAGLPPGWGLACLLNSDCPQPLICGARNACAFECNEARDCSGGACCYEHTCRRGPICTGELPDGGLIDGGVRDGGSYCLNDLACDDGNFCNGIELCSNNVCRPAAHPICDDFNPCSLDMCDAINRRCSYASLGQDAGDADLDGHPAVQCGGTSDDCDDSNPRVHPGHPEDCDFIDNNCDGQVDEGLWRERVGARISLHGAARFPWWGGPPSVVSIDGGFIIGVSSDTIDGALELVRTDGLLALQQGPLPLFRSRTTWLNPPGMQTPFGRRLISPKLVSGDGKLLATAFMGSAPGMTQCPSNGYWTLELPLIQFDTQLAEVRAWSVIDTESVSSGCTTTTAPEWYYPRFANPQLVWSAGSNRWLVAWGVGQSTNQRYLTVATFDADGGLSNEHDLVPVTPSLIQMAQTYDEHQLDAPIVGAMADRVLVAWNASSPGQPRYVLMDTGLNSSLSPLIDIYENTRLIAGGVTEDGRRFYLATRSYSTAPAVVRELDTDGGIARGPWAFPAVRESAFTQPFSLGINSADRPDVKPFRDGYLAASMRWPDIAFSFMSTVNDGGVVTTLLPMTTAPRSQVVVVPIDDTTVGLVWTDGELKRTLMECRP